MAEIKLPLPKFGKLAGVRFARPAEAKKRSRQELRPADAQ